MVFLNQQPMRGNQLRFVVLMMAFAGVAMLTGTLHAEDWPGFRGATADGRSTEQGIFSEGHYKLSVDWKVTIGSGYSGVAVAEGTVVTAFADGESDVMVAFEESTGRERWRMVMDKTYVGHDGSHDGPIATPFIGGGRVFGLAPRGRLLAVDLKSGELAWSTDLVADHGARKPHYGFATSPLLHDGVLVVEVGAEDGAVAGFDPGSGSRLWKVGEDGIQYQSPVVSSLGGREQVLAAGNTKLMGIDVRQGKLLWDYAHGGGGPLGAGSLTAVPLGDDRFFLSHKDDRSTAVRLSVVEGKAEGTALWEDRSIRNSYNVPVCQGGHIYAFSSRFLTCVDASSGESTWRSRLPGDGFTILVDGHVVVLTKRGSVHLIAADPSEYRDLASVQVFDDMAWSPPAFANGHIVARGLKELARVKITSGQSEALPDEDDESSPRNSPFARFIEELQDSDDKSEVIDQFMAKHPQTPIVEDGWVHFVYRGPGHDIAIGSDLFGARQERSMQRLAGTDFFHYSSRVPLDTRANYLFIKDFEEHLVDARNDRRTTTIIYAKEMEMNFGGAEMEMSWFAMPGWKPPGFMNPADASRRGRVEHQKFTSELESADVEFDVYLPNGYDDSGQTYPVVYVHGGQAAQERGKWIEALDNLIGSEVKPLIAVFVHYAPSMFRPNNYVGMFENELVPFVDKNFRTIADAKSRATVGAGFVGSSAIACALAESQLFGKLGCQSPFIFGAVGDKIKSQLASRSGPPLTVYLEWGTFDLRNPDEAWDMSKSVAEFADEFRKAGHDVQGGEVHDGTGWSSWSNRTDRLLKSLFAAG